MREECKECNHLPVCKEEQKNILTGICPYYEPEKKIKLCPHCNTNIKIRNLSGYCDHLYYPENCETCKKIRDDKNSE